MSDKEQVEAMADRVRREVGDVNILVNNAGIMINKQFMLQTDEEVLKTINVSALSLTMCHHSLAQVNLMGQIWVLRQFLPAMIRMDRGSIVFMCGLPGHAGAPNM